MCYSVLIDVYECSAIGSSSGDIFIFEVNEGGADVSCVRVLSLAV